MIEGGGGGRIPAAADEMGFEGLEIGVRGEPRARVGHGGVDQIQSHRIRRFRVGEGLAFHVRAVVEPGERPTRVGDRTVRDEGEAGGRARLHGDLSRYQGRCGKQAAEKALIKTFGYFDHEAVCVLGETYLTSARVVQHLS